MSILDDLTDALGDAEKLKQIAVIIGAAVSLGTLAVKAINDLKSDDAANEVTDEMLNASAEESRTLAAIVRRMLVNE